MDANVNVTLINEQGWQKQYQLNEGVHWVGSAANAQIQIVDVKEISPYHLQVVNNKSEACIRLLNLSKDEIILQKAGKQTPLEAGGFTDIFGEVTLYLGNYTLQFIVDKEELQKEAVLERKQKVIGVRLVLSDVVLRPDAGPLIGTLSLQNLGSEPCQFEVNLEGLPPDCYEVLPPPLIYAGGEENTEIRIFHRHVSPPAGLQTLTLRVSAPAVYPGKEIRVEQVIKVLSCYEHSLTFLTPATKQVEPAPAKTMYRQDVAVSEEVPPLPAWPSEQTEPVFQTPIAQDQPVSIQDQSTERVQDQTVRIEGRREEVKMAAAEENLVVVQLPPVIAEPVPPPESRSILEEQAPAEIRPTPGEESSAFEQPVPQEEVQHEEVEPAVQTLQEPEQPAVGTEAEAPVFRGVRKPSRPDLSSVKVMKASTGEFLQKKDGES